ncbi:hypothetical protein BDY24DRAFT_343492 [Mrakia frigida]|uniref:Chs5p n=1 Tax=Mrakia frigida TaxID=29902 RepID=UPI003FCBFA04
MVSLTSSTSTFLIPTSTSWLTLALFRFRCSHRLYVFPLRLLPISAPSTSSSPFAVLHLPQILIGERAHLIEFPSLLLPPGSTSGSIVSISVHRNVAAEQTHARAFSSLQSQILQTYGTESPQAPVLSLRNTTQTSVTLEWGKLELANAKLRGVEIYRNGTRLAAIPNPGHNTSTKLSSLSMDTDYTFQLVMKTTAGTYPSNVIRVRTHTINDTSGISVCFGTVQDPHHLHQAKIALDQMGAKYSDKIQIDTTHFVCTTPAGPVNGSGPSVEYQKALQLTLPVVEPGWVLACLHEKK